MRVASCWCWHRHTAVIAHGRGNPRRRRRSCVGSFVRPPSRAAAAARMTRAASFVDLAAHVALAAAAAAAAVFSGQGGGANKFPKRPAVRDTMTTL